VARVLIVGGEDRATALANALLDRGYAVRLVDVANVPAGAERFAAKADRPGTLKAALEHVTIACWLFGTLSGGRERAQTLNGARLERFLHQTIDSSVRGLLYEAVGDAGEEVLAEGRRVVGEFAEHNAVPLALVAREAPDTQNWLAQALEGVDALVDRYSSSIP
jgi:hypothetical protein